MKMYFIADNVDTEVGMRLAGVEGVVLHERDEVRKALNQALQRQEIGVLLVTEKIAGLIPEEIREIKRNRQVPLIVTIPDRHGSSGAKDSITQYIREAIGLKI